MILNQMGIQWVELGQYKWYYSQGKILRKKTLVCGVWATSRYKNKTQI